MFETHNDSSLIFLSLASMIRTFSMTLVEAWDLTGEDAKLAEGYHIHQCHSRDEAVFSSLFGKKLGVTCNFIPPDRGRRKKHKYGIFCQPHHNVSSDSSPLKPLCDDEIAERSKKITLSQWDYDYHLELILRYPNLGGIGETTRDLFDIDEITPGVFLFLRKQYLVQVGDKYKWTDRASESMQNASHWDEKKRCKKEEKEKALNRRFEIN